MSLASGHAVTRLVIKTLEDSIRIPCPGQDGGCGPRLQLSGGPGISFRPASVPMLDGFSK